MPDHKITIAHIGSQEHDTFVILIDGEEFGDPLSHADAVTVSDWVRANITHLKGKL